MTLLSLATSIGVVKRMAVALAELVPINAVKLTMIAKITEDISVFMRWFPPAKTNESVRRSFSPVILTY
ncbi:MAG: hypothetical protein COB78_02205 [Hyphomicrobiales bacterium]|nr:MAG: hypothetical protein COB78_02205 [Hyphomicrobiales bacterium]